MPNWFAGYLVFSGEPMKYLACLLITLLLVACGQPGGQVGAADAELGTAHGHCRPYGHGHHHPHA